MGFIMFSQIDEVDFCDHCYLSVGDKCFYHGEYTPRRGFNYSETNNLILNLKKDMSRKETPEWRYKEEAIEKCAKLIRDSFPSNLLLETTFVPAPPSKMKDEFGYDDRLIQILRRVNPDKKSLDIRELIVQVTPRTSMHMTSSRYTPADLQKKYCLNTTLFYQSPFKRFVVFDDVLTNGTHFRAMSDMLKECRKDITVEGVFIAKVCRNNNILDGFYPVTAPAATPSSDPW